MPSSHARLMLPLGLTDFEFEIYMQSFYRAMLTQLLEQSCALDRWADDGGPTL